MTSPSFANTSITPAFGWAASPAWRWPLVLGLLMTLVCVFASVGWNLWPTAATTNQMANEWLRLNNARSLIDGVGLWAAAPWDWPAWPILLLAALKAISPVTLGSGVAKVFFALGSVVWLVLFRLLMRRWGWPPVARWGALTVLVAHPAFWASLSSGAGWQGAYMVLIWLAIPAMMPPVVSARLRVPKAPKNRLSMEWLTGPVRLGLLLGGSLYVLGVAGFVLMLATVLLGVWVCKTVQPRNPVAWAAMLQSCLSILALFSLVSLISYSLTTFFHGESFPNPSLGLFVGKLTTYGLSWLSMRLWFLAGGLWLILAGMVAWQLPSQQAFVAWNDSLPKRGQPAMVWPHSVWLIGLVLALVCQVWIVAAFWLAVGLGQSFQWVDSDALLQGPALRWLDIAGVFLVVCSLMGAIVLFQGCPDALPWWNSASGPSSGLSAIVTVSLGTLVWEIAWWKLMTSIWLLSLILLGFGLLLRGPRLTGQQGVGMMCATLLWLSFFVHAGVLPWVQPIPLALSELSLAFGQQTVNKITFHQGLSVTAQQVSGQSLGSAWFTSPKKAHSRSGEKNTLTAWPEREYYSQERPESTDKVIAHQLIPVIKGFPGLTSHWLDVESVVWVASYGDVVDAISRNSSEGVDAEVSASD